MIRDSTCHVLVWDEEAGVALAGNIVIDRIHYLSAFRSLFFVAPIDRKPAFKKSKCLT